MLMDKRMIKDSRTSFATSSSFIIFQILTAIALGRTTKNNVKRNVFKFVFRLFVLVYSRVYAWPCLLPGSFHLENNSHTKKITLTLRKTIQIFNLLSIQNNSINCSVKKSVFFLIFFFPHLNEGISNKVHFSKLKHSYYTLIFRLIVITLNFYMGELEGMWGKTEKLNAKI